MLDTQSGISLVEKIMADLIEASHFSLPNLYHDKW